jgi:hypothetical protein
VLVPLKGRRTPAALDRSVGRALLSKQLSATRLVPAPPQSFFSAEAHPLEQPPEGRFAKRLASKALQEVAPVCDGSSRSLAYIFLKEPLRSLVGFRGSSTSLSGSERLSPVGESDVAFDRGEADAKEAGGLGLGHTTLDSLNYLLTQIS